MDKLDKKDYEILRLLDKNFRMSFSQIAKKVKLSKNSVALRFKKLEKYLLHNTTGINYELLGYSMVKVFYTLDLYKEDFEKLIINEVKKHPSILWAARFYGKYNLCICLLVNDMNVLIEH
ncbi:MAG: Lrp/AsnC family transcriptional regulator [archaeon]